MSTNETNKIGDGRKNNLPNRGRGRPPGAKNKATLRRADLVNQILESLDHRNAAAEKKFGPGATFLDTLDARDYKDLLKVVVPKHSSIEIEGRMSWADMVKELAKNSEQ